MAKDVIRGIVYTPPRTRTRIPAGTKMVRYPHGNWGPTRDDDPEATCELLCDVVLDADDSTCRHVVEMRPI